MNPIHPAHLIRRVTVILAGLTVYGAYVRYVIAKGHG